MVGEANNDDSDSDNITAKCGKGVLMVVAAEQPIMKTHGGGRRCLLVVEAGALKMRRNGHTRGSEEEQLV